MGRVEVLVVAGILDTPCHVWQGATLWGYPRRRVTGVRYMEHRRAWAEEHGPIPDGHEIHHICGIRRCINVEHLALVTRSEHLKRHRSAPLPDEIQAMLAEQSDLGDTHAKTDHRKAPRSHCQRGHEQTSENVIRVRGKAGQTWNYCRVCHELRRQRQRERSAS